MWNRDAELDELQRQQDILKHELEEKHQWEQVFSYVWNEYLTTNITEDAVEDVAAEVKAMEEIIQRRIARIQRILRDIEINEMIDEQFQHMKEIEFKETNIVEKLMIYEQLAEPEELVVEDVLEEHQEIIISSPTIPLDSIPTELLIPNPCSLSLIDVPNDLKFMQDLKLSSESSIKRGVHHIKNFVMDGVLRFFLDENDAPPYFKWMIAWMQFKFYNL